MDTTPYTYMFIRTDLSTPQQIVQASHAALEAGDRFGPHSHLVLIGMESEQALLKAVSTLEEHGIRTQTFLEPDHNTGYTASCTEPLIGERRRPLRKFPLFKQGAVA